MARKPEPDWARKEMAKQAAVDDQKRLIDLQLEQQAAAARAANDKARRDQQQGQ